MFDKSVGFRSETRTHEQVLNVAQAAEFAIEQIFTVAGSEESAGNDDFAGVKLLLIEFAAANLEQNLRRGAGRRSSHPSDVMHGQGKDRFIVGEGR